MKKLLFYLLVTSYCVSDAQSTWVQTASPASIRYEDISFVSPDTGWAVCNNQSIGYIYSTQSGGTSWSTQKSAQNVYMRSVKFATKKLGFAGGLEFMGKNVFFRTTDGGATWTDISSVITGTQRGICGIFCVDSNVTYAVGVWATPAYVMKTTNGGNTWTQIDMSAYAASLIDVNFTDANNGYVTGRSNASSEGAVILKTTDGGASWTKVFMSNAAGEVLWKIQNLDGQNWFASIEAAIGPMDSTANVFVKSTDGGNSWVVKPAPFGHYFQGIGFMDTQRGWIGYREIFETNDGGTTWARYHTNQPTNTFNRFQKVNATTAYLGSTFVYKLGTPSTGVAVKSAPAGEEARWLSLRPNPSQGHISIQLDLPHKTMYGLKVISAGNAIVWEEVNQKEKGSYRYKTNNLAPGVYYVHVMFNEHAEYQKVIVE